MNIPDWLPNWRDANCYPNLTDVNPSEWVWEFLRRNIEYQKVYKTYIDFLEYLDTNSLIKTSDNTSVLEAWEKFKRERSIFPQQPLPITEGTYSFFPFDMNRHFSLDTNVNWLPDPSKIYADFGIHERPIFTSRPYTNSGYRIYGPPNYMNGKLTSVMYGNGVCFVDISTSTDIEIQKEIEDSKGKVAKTVITKKGKTFICYNIFVDDMKKEVFEKNEKFSVNTTSQPMKMLAEVSLDENIDSQLEQIALAAKGAQNQLKDWGILKEKRRLDDNYLRNILRTYDAILCEGETIKPELSQVLLPGHRFDTDRNYAKQIDNWHRRAKEFVDGGHINVLAKFTK